MITGSRIYRMSQNKYEDTCTIFIVTNAFSLANQLIRILKIQHIWRLLSFKVVPMTQGMTLSYVTCLIYMSFIDRTCVKYKLCFTEKYQIA